MTNSEQHAKDSEPKESYLVAAIGSNRGLLAQCYARDEAQAKVAMEALAMDLWGGECKATVIDRRAPPGLWFEGSARYIQTVVQEREMAGVPVMEALTKSSEAAEVTKITQIIQRDDGSEARIVATAFFGEGLHRSVGVYVHRRESPSHEWVLCSDRPHPDWRSMSVEEYVKHGRSPMLQAVSVGELLRVSSAIGKPMAQFDLAEENQPQVHAQDISRPRGSCP